MTQGIKDKMVVITGASSGLEEAAARRLARYGAKLVLGARRLERLQALARELSLGNDAAVQTDVTQCAQVRHLVDDAVQSHGRIDVIVNNAGLMPQSLLERGKVEEWDRMIDVNIKGLLYGIAAALPYMKLRRVATSFMFHRLPATRWRREAPYTPRPNMRYELSQRDCGRKSSRTTSGPL
jgi:NADP-dependent 3-hydroxy acid dehydrogenase YdfG